MQREGAEATAASGRAVALGLLTLVLVLGAHSSTWAQATPPAPGAAGPSPARPPSPVAWAGLLGSSAVGAVVGGAFTVVGLLVRRRQEREKMWEELALARSSELIKNRIEKYAKLWGLMTGLSMYPLPKGITSKDLGVIHDDLRKWYFDLGGGMFLSRDQDGTPGSRTRYFALQSGLRKSCEELAGNATVLVTEADSLGSAEAARDEEACDHYRPEHDLPRFSAAFARYRFLRALGSRLRSSIVEDLGTRAAPLRRPE